MEPAAPRSAARCATLTSDLVARIRAGDRSAWDALYGRYRDRLLFAVRSRLGPALRRKLESEDILQSVLLEALGELPAFAPAGDDGLRHFLHVLITRKIRDRADTFGAAKRAGDVPLDAVAAESALAPTPPTYADGPRFEALERALVRLPDDLREILLLRKIDGLPSAEVARRLGLSDAAVRKATSRGMARLTRLALEEERRAGS
ncbi:MAG TPA: sigma-70 family RNA polymerase sigma factor [Planctomycetota bacterium]|nr:sigma-70 family RNA polymerase sigma factor [Planctomycetota bacterium]